MKLITSYLEIIYPAEANNIDKILTEYIRQLPEGTAAPENSDWYRAMVLYSTYPDSIIYDKQLSPLKNLQQHLAHIKSLGCNALHILPFLNSPLIDKGFDVSDYLTVRPALGDFADLLAVKNAAQESGIEVIMDLVLNHVSDQHEWFKQAEQGNEQYREYFITTRQKPSFIRKILHNSIVFAEYLVNDQLLHTNIPFPEHAGEIPNWRQGKDGYWYYHTYYPQQLDLNWLNPKVFIEIAMVMLYWASLGFHFRLDAIRYVGRPAYKRPDGYSMTTHLIISALKLLVKQVNANCVFIAESFEKLPTVITYFGEPGRVETELSYNFHLNTWLWVTIIKQDAAFLWPILREIRHIPPHAEWINFLRNHDEESLAHLDDKLRQEIRDKLIIYGADFRMGCGVSGRAFALLGYDLARFRMAYFLLASLPGSIMLPYGDEIACRNVALAELTPQEKLDTRNINRGQLHKENFTREEAQLIARWFTRLFNTRKKLLKFFRKRPKRLAVEQGLFAIKYPYSAEQEFIAVVNLTPTQKQLTDHYIHYQLLFPINEVAKTNDSLNLGPYAGVWLIKHHTLC